MLKLWGSSMAADAGVVASGGPTRHLLRVFSSTCPEDRTRSASAWLVSAGQPMPPGFGCYLLLERVKERFEEVPAGCARMILPDAFDYLAEGDIVRANFAKGTIGVLFRANSSSNTLLVTEQCNHYCLMCSQPPKRPADRWLVQDAKEVVRMMPATLPSLGISGGEPTLLGDDLLELLQIARDHLPRTFVDLLSNGRRFSDWGFARQDA